MSELAIWMRWRQKYGPHNPVRMYDQPAGLITWQVGRVNGIKDTAPIDYMPYSVKPEPDEITGDELVSALEMRGKVKYGR